MLNKSIDQWLTEYGESHQNPTNKLIQLLSFVYRKLGIPLRG